MKKQTQAELTFKTIMTTEQFDTTASRELPLYQSVISITDRLNQYETYYGMSSTVVRAVLYAPASHAIALCDRQ